MPVPQLLQRHITTTDLNPSPSSVKAGTTLKEFLADDLANAFSVTSGVQNRARLTHSLELP